MLSPKVLARIDATCAAADRETVAQALADYRGAEAERVALDVLTLSRGEVEAVRRYVQAALRDYRDVLYWAEYYDSDPLLEGRDPEQLVRELLAQFGDKH